MSRRTQNLLLGSVACLVAAAAMVATALALDRRGDQQTAAIEPAAGTVDQRADSALALADPSPTTVGRALAVAITQSSTSSTSATSSSSTASSSSTTTTVATTSTEPTSTSSSTSSSTATSSTMPDSSSSTTSTAPGSSTSSTSTTIRTTLPPESSTTTEPPTTTTNGGGGSLNAIEREIARLTNELRTNPNGPMKRTGPVIDCGGRVRVAGGGYESIPALSLHEGASLQVARPWSQQMTRSNFSHRPGAGFSALEALGLSLRSAGENIAYHSYSDKALNHFVGWRESDGHFCNMMDPGFTHIGVGEETKSNGLSFATQNFFSLR